MEVGEKYLTIQLLGQKALTIAAFKNKKKSKTEHPDYSGNGVAVWINEKRAPKPGTATQEL